jgi:hypothetical protein
VKMIIFSDLHAPKMGIASALQSPSNKGFYKSGVYKDYRGWLTIGICFIKKYA